MLTFARAVEVLDYRPDTGEFLWKPRARHEFARERLWRTWNTRWAGKPAGSIGLNGYQYIVIDATHHLAHRVAWLIQMGEFPSDDIDHENGDRSDNRFANLRAVDRATNLKNVKRRRDNNSGVTGVHWAHDKQKWAAAIHVDGKSYFLGRYESFEEACAARADANARFGFHPNHGRAA